MGPRIRKLRKAKKLSQGDLQRRAGLKRSYVSRVENRHTTPNVATLEKFAAALEVPMYRLFRDGKKPPKDAELPDVKMSKPMWGTKGEEAEELRQLAKALSRMDAKQRGLLASMAQRLAKRVRKPR